LEEATKRLGLVRHPKVVDVFQATTPAQPRILKTTGGDLALVTEIKSIDDQIAELSVGEEKGRDLAASKRTYGSPALDNKF